MSNKNEPQMTATLAAAIKEAVAKVAASKSLSLPAFDVILEKPREKKFGDLASNVALILAATFKSSPRELAAAIVSQLPHVDFLQRVELAGPGFINFYISPQFWPQVVKQIILEKEAYGLAKEKVGEKILLEFVSANPVGPMHLGHGRWAAVGDSLSRLLKAAGYEVETEFYLNDFGRQMQLFGLSVACRYNEALGRLVAFPEEGYHGHYIKEIAQEILANVGDRYLSLTLEEQAQVFTDLAYKQVVADMKKTLAEMDVTFTHWFSERWLHESSYLKETVSLLQAKGYIYKKDGAVWFKTSLFGDDKDRVLIRENGQPTYFAADVAYHRHKFSRGYDRLINIWGADHHGYVKRIKAAAVALNSSSQQIEIVLGQLVNLFSGGRPVRMSKRTGEMVTLSELLAEVGKDATRYYFLMRSPDTALDFDIELAKSETQDNPVYYVQYAHARISSILRFAAEQGIKLNLNKAKVELLQTQAEIELMKQLADFPDLIKRAALARAAHRLTTYLQELATAFHTFYHQCRVVTEEEELTQARLALVWATAQVLKNGLNLIGVSAPTKM